MVAAKNQAIVAQTEVSVEERQVASKTAENMDEMMEQSSLPWWAWPIILFLTAFFLGIIAIPAGVGGGVLFVPIVGGFFPFHLDFVRSGSNNPWNRYFDVFF